MDQYRYRNAYPTGSRTRPRLARRGVTVGAFVHKPEALEAPDGDLERAQRSAKGVIRGARIELFRNDPCGARL